MVLQFIINICTDLKSEINKTIGILGGGQLGKMLFEAGSPMNLKYQFLEKTEDCPASLVSNNQVVGDLKDANKINDLAQLSDVLSYEIEHVNVNALEQLESEGKNVIPHSSVLKVIQDKGLQKNFYQNNQTPTLDFVIANKDNLVEKVAGWPFDKFVLKHRKGGYDGKGVQLLSKAKFTELSNNDDDSLKSDDGYVLEKLVENATEVSVIVAVGQQGDVTEYEPSEMVFDPKSNLMDYLITPSDISEAIAQKCKSIAAYIVKAFDSPGLFAVELFVDSNEQVFVNEIAPRPHNSGHHTIESCITSQYQQLNRILLGLPLGDTKLLSAAITCNIVGPQDVNGEYIIDNLKDLYRISGVYIHMYGKKTTSPYRKLGHFTILAETKEAAIRKMNDVKGLLKIKSI
jgi:5-(carboxyamino)imidazole ribonucleotide synthase